MVLAKNDPTSRRITPFLVPFDLPESALLL